MASPYRIRRCGAADIEAVVALWRQSPGLVLRAGDSPAAIRRFPVRGRGDPVIHAHDREDAC